MLKKRKTRINLTITCLILQILSAAVTTVANVDDAEANIRKYTPIVQEKINRYVRSFIR